MAACAPVTAWRHGRTRGEGIFHCTRYRINSRLRSSLKGWMPIFMRLKLSECALVFLYDELLCLWLGVDFHSQRGLTIEKF